MIRSILFILLCFISKLGVTQINDSIKAMQEVEVKGLELRSKAFLTPATIHSIQQKELSRFANTSLVPVFNTVPGVRMEERSPGSYRLSIRGSLLRSPFGVRNIKVYWKDIPLTDAGGNTYINLLDLNAIGGVEILKGPAGSVYGAGTGGVVSFSGIYLGDSVQNGGVAQFITGKYGTQNGAAGWQWNGKNGNLQVFQSLYHANGYRRNSQMKKAYSQISGKWVFSPKEEIEYLFMYSDLHYQTPGGLTMQQFLADPQQARPATATLPSAEVQKAGIFNKTMLTGITNRIQLSSTWHQISTLSLSLTNFNNPFIVNFEKRHEFNFALRQKWVYNREINGNKYNYIIGFETINGAHRIDSSGNKEGIPFGVTARDKISAFHNFLFTQGQWSFQNRIIVNAGVSYNGFGYDLKRQAPAAYRIHPDFKKAVLPRLAALLSLGANQFVQVSFSKGYSSPTLSEIRPSAGGFYAALQAESGWNKEIGIRGRFLGYRIRYDVTAFQFNLDHAIVRQLDNRGVEYFVNAGKVSQKGLEVYVEGLIIQRSIGFLRYLRVMNSSSFSHFRFVNYVSGNIDFSGNKLTGVPAQVVNTGMDLGFAKGVYLQGNFMYTSSLPLTDANDAFAGDYRLLQVRAGWKHHWGKGRLNSELFLSGDNLLNQQYSLGNDINAFGKRYFNPSPLANWISGIKLIF